MRLERFLAWRYLFNRSNRALVSVIAFISIAGVAVGVAALIVVISVIEGIDRDIFGKLVALQPHVKISRVDRAPIGDPGAIVARLGARPEIVRAEPIVARQVMFETESGGETKRLPGQLIGAEEYGPDRVYAIPNSADGGALRLRPRETILGAPLHYRLGSPHGGRVLVTTGVLGRGGGSFRPRMRNLDVVGLYQSGIWDFDMVSALASLDTAREVFGVPAGAADFVQAKLRNPVRGTEPLAVALAEELGPEYRIATWQEENREFFQALRLEKIGLTVVLLLVVVVAGFNIVGTLLLMVMEKRRQIGALKAMGATEGTVRRVFLGAGAVVGVLGSSVGLALGLFGCYAVKHWVRLSDMPDSAYGFNRLPVVVNATTVAAIVVSALAIAVLSALFPAAQAARLDPVEALRHD